MTVAFSLIFCVFFFDGQSDEVDAVCAMDLFATELGSNVSHL